MDHGRDVELLPLVDSRPIYYSESFCIEAGLHEKLEAAARQRKLRKDQVIGQAIEEWLDEREAL